MDIFGMNPFELHVEEAFHQDYIPENSVSARAGSVAECGREIHIHLALDSQGKLDAGYQYYGLQCSAMVAVGSAVCTLVQGKTLLQAARIGAEEISEEVGGLTAKRFAAEFAADALAWSLGALLVSLPKADAPIDNRVAVALSGGVDSAVTAHLLKQQGMDLIAVTVELWRDDQTDAEKSCCSASAVRLARSMAHKMDMPHFTVDLRQQFRAEVVSPWVNMSTQGQVGNPCITCNGDVRIDGMLEQAMKVGYGRLATGHYTKLSYEEDNGYLHANPDANRDQSYMLARLKPSTLRRLIFPLGGIDKSQVREIASQAGIVVAQRPDSQDLCFLAGEGKVNFLKRVGGLSEEPGDIVNLAGQVVGEHYGVGFYTIGQRRKLPIHGGNHNGLRVVQINAGEKQLVVGSPEEMMVDSIKVRGVNIHKDGINGVRLRSHGEVYPCKVEGDLGYNREVTVHFHEPVEVPQGGQSACLMQDDMIVGQGVIAPTRLLQTA